jgi:hypothetical protein
MSLDDHVPGELLLEAAPPRQPQPLSQLRVVEQRFQLVREIAGIPRLAQQPTVAPSATVYGSPPMRLATTGLPAAIASTDVRLSPSWATVGTTVTSVSA